MRKIMECEKMRTFDYTKLKEQKWDSEKGSRE